MASPTRARTSASSSGANRRPSTRRATTPSSRGSSDCAPATYAGCCGTMVARPLLPCASASSSSCPRTMSLTTTCCSRGPRSPARACVSSAGASSRSATRPAMHASRVPTSAFVPAPTPSSRACISSSACRRDRFLPSSDFASSSALLLRLDERLELAHALLEPRLLGRARGATFAQVLEAAPELLASRHVLDLRQLERLALHPDLVEAGRHLAAATLEAGELRLAARNLGACRGDGVTVLVERERRPRRGPWCARRARRPARRSHWPGAPLPRRAPRPRGPRHHARLPGERPARSSRSSRPAPAARAARGTQCGRGRARSRPLRCARRCRQRTTALVAVSRSCSAACTSSRAVSSSASRAAEIAARLLAALREALDLTRLRASSSRRAPGSGATPRAAAGPRARCGT